MEVISRTAHKLLHEVGDHAINCISLQNEWHKSKGLGVIELLCRIKNNLLELESCVLVIQQMCQYFESTKKIKSHNKHEEHS